MEKRFYPDIDKGLNSEQIEQRINEKLYNFDTSVETKPIWRIIKNNVFTLFNILNIILAIALLYVKSYKNLMFMGVILCNTVISIVQEIRAKRTIDKLSMLSSIKAHVIRNGEKIEVDINKLVLDDIICLEMGSQVPADSIIVSGSCNFDESMLTGEFDPISKKVGELILSGSYVTSGSCIARVEHIGEKNYISTISKDAKKEKKIESQIMKTINRIIKFLSIAIIPIGIILYINQLSIFSNRTDLAVVHTVAALIGMIPEGLVLLTSTVLAVGIMRLSKHKVLVQELYGIETLACVDTLCLDKTGTITEGKMELFDIVPLNENDMDYVNKKILFLCNASTDENSTINAIKVKYKEEKSENFKHDINFVPFSSKKKWSGAYCDQEGSVILGSAEFILKENMTKELGERIKKVSYGKRVLLLASSKLDFNQEELPSDIKPIALILIKDKIRENAKDILNYFKKQDVNIKIISGDGVGTVSSIAKEVGVDNYDKYVDLSKVDDEKLGETATEYSIFCRVSPFQKKDLIKSMRDNGNVVAMTGDGVNDVLALKEANCSIAMASGSDAARNIAQLILLDSDFESMPNILDEGRRCINNISRSSSLFLVKTIYSAVLAVIFAFINSPYPFEPIQMTLLNLFTIGIPSFILALEPNHERVKESLWHNLIRRSVPSALTVITNILLINFISKLISLPFDISSTISIMITGTIGIAFIYRISKPLNKLRTILLIFVILGFSTGVLGFSNLFSLHPFNFWVWGIYFILLPLSIIELNILLDFFNKFVKIDNSVA